MNRDDDYSPIPMPDTTPIPTKRELFAAMAMQGNLSCPMTEEAAFDLVKHTGGDPQKIAAIQAGWAVQYADALIAALQTVKGECCE